MSRSPNADYSFLLPGHLEILECEKALAVNIESRPDIIMFPLEGIRESLGAMRHQASQSAQITREKAALPPVSSLDTLTPHLQMHAAQVLILDARLGAMKSAAARSAAFFRAVGNEKWEEGWMDVGMAAIEARTKHAATSLMEASFEIITTLPGDEDSKTLWVRARDGYDQTGRPQPVAIDAKEGAAHDALVGRLWTEKRTPVVEPLMVPSTSRVRNVFRGAKAIAKLAHESLQGDPLEVVKSVVGMIAVLDLTHEEQAQASRFARKAARYLTDISTLKPEIGSDPRTRALVLLSRELRAVSTLPEQSTFEQYVQKATKQVQKRLARVSVPTE